MSAAAMPLPRDPRRRANLRLAALLAAAALLCYLGIYLYYALLPS